MSQSTLVHAARRFWLGVVAQDHVARGVAGGFAQVCHGKAAPLRRMAMGDGFVYYSPATSMRDGLPLQAFTPIGQVRGDELYSVAMTPDFTPSRRNIRWMTAQAASIRPLLARLSFITDQQHWGYVLRRGHLEISIDDFRAIAAAMQAGMNAVAFAYG